MKEKTRKADLHHRKGVERAGDNPEGYPSYPAIDDIYGKCKKEEEINPEDLSGIKETNSTIKTGKSNEKAFIDDFSGNDLDVPGSELDDESEIIGSEDEENNYYSLGGDEHSDLDEHNEELNP